MASPKQWYNMKLLLVFPSGRTCSGEPLAARPWWRWKSTAYDTLLWVYFFDMSAEAERMLEFKSSLQS